MKMSREDSKIFDIAISSVHKSIQCVMFKPGEIIATNGAILAIREIRKDDDKEDFEPFFLNAEKTKGIFSVGGQLTPKDKIVTYEAKRYTKKKKIAEDLGFEVNIKKEKDIKYPAYEKVMIPKKEKPDLMFDIKQLKSILKAFEGCRTLELTIKDNESVMRIDSETEDKRSVVGFIMPLLRR